MNTVEKLEQSGIVKEKGTQYFKVCTVDTKAHIYKETFKVTFRKPSLNPLGVK